jgi:TonB family protein
MEEKGPPPAYIRRVQERIDLAVIAQTERRGNGPAVAVSIVAHVLLIAWLVANYHPVSRNDAAPPIARYVELIRQNPSAQQFTEAPGRKLDKPVQSALLSDANRQAAMPKPTGPTPTPRPGNGGFFTPAPSRGDHRPKSPQPQPEVPAQQSLAELTNPNPLPTSGAAAQSASSLSFRQQPESMQQANAAAHGAVDWRNAIKSVKVASLGSGDQGPELGNTGGTKGFANEGPLSFETTWFDWGDYAQGMVSRIRVNWYEVMPDLLRTGMQGVVTIRFTIHRDGRISDATILNSSGVPPYDFAAKKAIENSSPLAPLPKNFPNETERVTCMFYYNMEIPNK